MLSKFLRIFIAENKKLQFLSWVMKHPLKFQGIWSHKSPTGKLYFFCCLVSYTYEYLSNSFRIDPRHKCNIYIYIYIEREMSGNNYSKYIRQKFSQNSALSLLSVSPPLSWCRQKRLAEQSDTIIVATWLPGSLVNQTVNQSPVHLYTESQQNGPLLVDDIFKCISRKKLFVV